MRLRIFLIINAVTVSLYGIVLLILPAQMEALYGFEVSEPLTFAARLLGAYLLAFGILSWLIRNAAYSETRKAALYAFFTMDVLGLLVSLIYLLNGTLNAQGWFVAAIFLLLGLGFAYFLFIKPKAD